ncbi:MAG: UDP-N-acetylmuramoyl-L-alanyl-D-glutamate--2,6-diaminopimelate ligase [Ignavibacteriales bacterium]|nr:UDP-N-acetylmuramoyl-L-alanyl-D-glutamate--2,6-diaminopimelate ligase [Ignavibacteriales bacterium]
MKLSPLLAGIQVTKMFQTMFGRMVVTHDVEVRGIQYDSRRVQRGDCFVALVGQGTNGHLYLQEAINRGASVLVVQDDDSIPDSLCMHRGVIKIVVSNTRTALALLSANFYGHPSRKLTVIGVTGTNGKTTTTHLIKSMFEAAGQKTGLIGTIHHQIDDQSIPASHTTPESLELNKLLADMVASGCSAVSMEVSSHALHQSRVHGIHFSVAVFTNLSQDHLDYHKTMQEYFEAKKTLFETLDPSACTVTNRDDDWGRKIFAAARTRTLSYGFDAEADVRVLSAGLSLSGTSITIEYRGMTSTLQSPLVGRFNVYNLLGAYAVGIGLELPPDRIRLGLGQVSSVRGRFERITSPAGWTAIVDYAHTPDALEKCLHAIHEVLPREQRGAILAVFGAGGDRDASKRPLMGAVAAELADLCIITSDNPRTEDPGKIIDDILKGVNDLNRVVVQPDRREAIREALTRARPGDVILIAGKGHEDYQILGKNKIHFSDHEIVQEFIRSSP